MFDIANHGHRLGPPWRWVLVLVREVSKMRHEGHLRLGCADWLVAKLVG